MKKLIVAALAVFATSCVCPDEAEKATFDVIHPAHMEYVLTDDKLDQEAKERRVRLLESWRAKVEAEQQIGCEVIYWKEIKDFFGGLFGSEEG